MHALSKMLVTCVALALGMGVASAREGRTTADLALRAGPGAKYELLLTMPASASVAVGSCAQGWCKVTWNSYAGYASESGLALDRVEAAAAAEAPSRPFQPVLPPYPYHAGHYPTADSYYDLPPYTDISPSWYRWRYFLTFREHGRYRYVPYVFNRSNYRN